MKLKLLRPNAFILGENGVSGSDRYLLNTLVPKNRHEVIAWLKAQATFPTPGVTMAEFDGRTLVCGPIRCEIHPKSRIHWNIVIDWLPFSVTTEAFAGVSSAGGARDITNPSPRGAEEGGTIQPDDPNTWEPVVFKRTARRSVPDTRAYYEGGYSGESHTFCNTEPTKKRQVVTSALVPFANPPEFSRAMSYWSVRVTKRGPINIACLEVEDCINTSSVTLSHKGVEVVWAAKTALCESVELSQTLVKDEWAWNIEFQIIHNKGGWVNEIADRGFDARAWPGVDKRLDSKDSNVTITDPDSWSQRIIDKVTGRAITQPVFLNGNGKPLKKTESIVYGKWRQHETKAFASVPYLNEVLA